MPFARPERDPSGRDDEPVLARLPRDRGRGGALEPRVVPGGVHAADL
ncbi:MAG: hypothetical protein QOE10_1989 [Gaiellales bacterium]|nr:hypothetical protein [Gaiellales bacterium]